MKRSFSGRFLVGLAAGLGVLAGAAGAQADPVATATAIAVAPGNPVSDGTIVSFTATVTASETNHAYVVGQPVAGSTVQLQQYQVAGAPAAAGTLGGAFETLDTAVTNASGQASFNWDSAGFGGQTIGFRLHTLPQGPHSPGQSQSPAVDLVITSGCTGLQIGATLATGDGNPLSGTYSWTFRIEVHNCDLDSREFKVQGGTNGWAPLTGLDVSKGTFSVRENRKNQVITWLVELEPGETQYIDVTVGGTIGANTPDGTILFLSGAWSAAYVDDLGDPAKSDYTGRVSVVVSNP